MTEILTEPTRLDSTLSGLASEYDMTHADTARVLLGVSAEELRSHIEVGNLAAVCTRGDTWVATEHIRALSWVLTQQRTSELVSLREPMTALLRTFLAERPVALLYDEAVHEGRPLLSARRGRVRTDVPDVEAGDLGGHGLVVAGQVLSEYAREHPGIHSDIERLPIGPGLVWRLCTLDGIDEQSHVTAHADERGRSRRVSGWLRLDPAKWAPNLTGVALAVIRGELR